jgi:hypothetical protein
MKQITIALLCLLVAGTGVAQNRKIDLHVDQPWQEMLEKARATDRYIFMAVSAVWCGPCRVLERDVFTLDSVADFFNQNFFNTKYDMEKGDGIAIRNKYAVSAVPTLLWIDPKTEEVVHRVAGARSGSDLIEQGETALRSDNTSLYALRKEYEESGKTIEGLRTYLAALGRGGMSIEQTRVVLDFLAGFSNEKLMEEDNWGLLTRYVRDPFAAPVQQVFANRALFSETKGADVVNRFLNGVIQGSTTRFVNTRDSLPMQNFDQEGFDALVKFLETLKEPSAALALLQLRVAGYAQHEDFAGMIRGLDEYSQARGMQDVFIFRHLTKLTQADNAAREKGIALIDKIIVAKLNNTNPPVEPAPGAMRVNPEQAVPSYYQIKAILLTRNGDEEGAAQAREAGAARAREAAERRGAGEGSGRRPAQPMR